VWLPPSNYKFSLSEKNKKRGLKFQYKWLTEYNWLSYSELKNELSANIALFLQRLAESIVSH